MLIRDGKIDTDAVKREALTELELKTILHKQGLSSYSEVQRCVLEPSGNFYVEEKDPLRETKERGEILKQITALTAEVNELKRCCWWPEVRTRLLPRPLSLLLFGPCQGVPAFAKIAVPVHQHSGHTQHSAAPRQEETTGS